MWALQRKERTVDDQLWRRFYQMIKRCARRLPEPKRRFVYSDALIAGMFFWALLHDKPQVWACRRSSYNGLFRPRRLPSVAEFNKRIRSPRFQMLLDLLEAESRRAWIPGGTLILDGRPLVVGGCSKDPDAECGRAWTGPARGYRVHELVDAETGVVVAWVVTSLKEAEPQVAQKLLAQAPPGSVVVADGNYDSAALYDLAASRGVTLRARPRKGAGQGHRRQSPHRLEGIRAWNANPVGWSRLRGRVERFFGWQSSWHGGLSPLPAWVRRQERVCRHVQGKLIVQNVRLTQTQPKHTTAA